MSDLDESFENDGILEDLIQCGKCGQDWLVETHKEGFVKTLSQLTGYRCKECGGIDPKDWRDKTKTMYPARKLSESQDD